jgi:hypothetical protein
MALETKPNLADPPGFAGPDRGGLRAGYQSDVGTTFVVARFAFPRTDVLAAIGRTPAHRLA